MHTVISGLGGLVFVAEVGGAVVLLHGELSGDGHKGERGVIADPRAGLVGLADAADLRIMVLVIKGVARRACIRGPGIHRERQGNRRVLVPVRVAGVGIGALKRVNERDERGTGGASASRAKEAKDEEKSEFVHSAAIYGC